MANEKRLIDANALLEDFGEEPMVWNDGEAEIQERNDWRRYKNIVESQPTVDAVEVVRCEDCKYYLTDTLYCQEHKTGYCTMDDVIKDKTHFCSYGERRDDV